MRIPFLILATVAMICGCDLGTYSSRYKEVAGSGASGSSVELAGSVVIDGNIKVRLPTVIGDEYSQRYGPSDEFRKARVYGMDFPGFKASFIGDKEGEGTWLPVQAYFYVTPTGSKSIVDFKQEMKKIVADKNPGYSERWEDVTVAGFDGKERVWAKLAYLGNQEFMVADGNGSTKREQFTAQMEMMVTTNGSQNLMVIFRSPASIFDTELQMSTIKSLQGFHE